MFGIDQADDLEDLYNATFIGIDGFGSSPTVGKRTFDKFQEIFFPDGANVYFASSKHSTASVSYKVLFINVRSDEHSGGTYSSRAART